MKRHKKLLSAAVALIMILSIAFSVLFIAKEAKHCCAVSDCRICQQINICLGLFSSISSDNTLAVSWAAMSFAVLLVIGIIKQSAVNNTLTELKVKLSN